MIPLDYKSDIYNFVKAPCTTCKNTFNSLDFTCQAFPGGIPDEILKGENQHRKPLKDQGNEIIYMPLEAFRKG